MLLSNSTSSSRTRTSAFQFSSDRCCCLQPVPAMPHTSWQVHTCASARSAVQRSSTLHTCPSLHPSPYQSPPPVLLATSKTCTGTQPEVESLYKRFRSLDRARKGYISAEELMSIPELSINPLAQRLVRAGVTWCSGDSSVHWGAGQ
jgi:hypothetical protein